MSWSRAARPTARRASRSTRPSSPRACERREGALGQVVGAERVLEPGVGGAGIDEKGVAQLADVAKALDRGCVERGQRHSIERDVVPERVADDLVVASHVELRAARLARNSCRLSCGPAAITAASTPLANASKFFLNISASFFACASYAAASFQVFLGERTSLGTPGTAVGTSKPKTGSFTYFAWSSWPESAAVTMARVCASFMREPVP